MPIDYSILSGFKSVGDYDRERQARQLEQQLVQAKLSSLNSGGSLPAPIQMANEFQKARENGDVQRMNDIAQFAKIYDRGVAYDPAAGGIAPMSGYGAAIGSIEAAKGGMKRQAESNVDLAMKPQIGRATAFEEALGKSSAASQGELKEKVAQMPALEKTVGELSELGKKATYTTIGRGIDAFRKEAQLDPRESAVARADYIAKVDNQVLPLLRQTFGAAFTQKEGETLRNTLGDPNKSPAEKDSVLKAFIEQKRADIATGIAQTQSLDDVLSNYQGSQSAPAASLSTPVKGDIIPGADGDYMFNGGNPADKANYKKVR